MKSGKLSVKVICCWVGAVIILLLLTTPAGADDDNKCYLEAAFEDILVAVWLADSEDNTKNQIWRGKIEVGKPQSIQSDTGHIRISTKDTDPGSTMINKGFHDCSGGNTISLSAH